MAGTYKSRKRERAGQNAIFVQWAILYTIVFVPIAMLVWSPFYREERSLIWGYDGLYQTYTTMVYYSNYWRTFFKNLFSGKFVLPMVDTSVGLGFDVFTSLNHYGFGDPLEILSIFFTEKNMEVCYNFLALLRYYLSGLAFGAYGLYMGRKQIPVLAGAFAYAFCGFALYAGVRHPYFMNSMIYFPLLCVGAEQILRKKQGWLLAVMTGIAACSNFYFLYMLTILTFLYAIVRFAALYGGKWKQEIRGRLLAGCGWYLLGIGLGSVFLIPNILAFFGNARGGIAAGFENTWFAYPAEFYKEMVIGCFFPEYSARYWCVLGYPPLLLLGLLFLLRRKADKKEQWLGVWFLILSLILWIPLGGYLMNGLSYVSHRWMYGYSFCAALILVYGVEKLHTVTAKEMFCYTGILSALGLLYRVNVGRLADVGGTVSAIILSVLVLQAVQIRAVKRRLHKNTILLLQSVMTASVVCAVLSSARWLYTEKGMHYTAEFQTSGTAWQKMAASAEVKLKNGMAEDAFYRVEGDNISEANYGMLHGINGTNPFFSIVGEDVYSYMKSLENPDAKFPNWYNGMGDRAAMMSLASVRYFARKFDSAMAVPYGYEKVDETEDGSLYESPYAMPLGYTYDKVMRRSEWDELTALQKQQALMQAAVLEDEDVSGYLNLLTGAETEKYLNGLTGADAKYPKEPAGAEAKNGDGVDKVIYSQKLSYEEESLPYTISLMENMSWNPESGKLSVDEGGGRMLLEFEGRMDAETYLRVHNFDTDGSGHELLYFYAGMGEGEAKKIYVTSNLSVWDGTFKNYLVAVGTGDGVCQTAELRFPFAGEFYLEDLEMYALPMEGFIAQARERQRETLKSLKESFREKGENQTIRMRSEDQKTSEKMENFPEAVLQGNHIRGEIRVSDEKILCISLPYSRGWRAEVDGNKVPVWKCNGMFLGIGLEKGTHTVEFSYRTPGMLVGFWITLASFAAAGGIRHYSQKAKKRNIKDK